MFAQPLGARPFAPRLDANKTWRGADKGVLDFGHAAVGGRLTRLDPASWMVCWADSGTRVSADQWAAMPARQRAALLGQVPAHARATVEAALNGGVAARATGARPAREAREAREARPDAQVRARVAEAARQATREHEGVGAACYDTANRTAHLAGGRDLDGAADVTAARGLGLAHLAASAAAGTLKPGMAVYMNLAPGTNPRSLNDETRPHWVTYLGQDARGVLRFADQYRADWTLNALIDAYGPRRIDLFADPFAAER